MSIEKASVAIITSIFFAFSCSFVLQNCMLRRLIVFLKTACCYYVLLLCKTACCVFLFKVFFYADKEIEELFLFLRSEVFIESLNQIIRNI